MNNPATLTAPMQTASVPKTMIALVLAAPKQFEAKEVAVPTPAADEVLVQLEGCGLCASSISVWEGRDWFSYPQEPGAPGHEGWGTIIAVGGQVKGWKTGDRVAMLSYHAYSPYDVAKADALVALPEGLDGIPFPGEPLGCAMNIFDRSQIKAGQTVAILGIGFLGALLVQLAKHAGARVIAISKRPYSLQVAASCGADETIAMDDHWRIIEEVKQLSGGRFCDVVIEATGKEWPLNLAGELTAERGRLVVAGFHQDGMRQVNMQLWNWRGLDVINAHERDPKQYIKGIENAVKAVEEGAVDYLPLLTHSYVPKNINQAFQDLQQRPDGYMKGWIKF